MGRYGTATKDQADKKQNNQFHKNYPTFSEAIQHCDKLTSTGLVLCASMYFYADEDGQLLPYELTEQGSIKSIEENKETYYLFIIIEDQKIKDISFEIPSFYPTN